MARPRAAARSRHRSRTGHRARSLPPAAGRSIAPAGQLPGGDSLAALLRVTDGLPAGPVLETVASDHAWLHRWDGWPTTLASLAAAFSPAPPLAVVYAAARRLQFHFAHRALRDLTDGALVDHPGDVFLGQLRLAAAAALGDATAWTPLMATAATGTTKQAHVALTAAVVAREVPAGVLAVALDLARLRAAAGDVVAAYRVVSLLRRAGHPDEAFDACDRACLAAAAAGPGLGEHLSERLLVERQLLAAGLPEGVLPPGTTW